MGANEDVLKWFARTGGKLATGILRVEVEEDRKGKMGENDGEVV